MHMHVLLLEKGDFDCYLRLAEGNMQSSVAEQNITQNHSKDHQGRTKSLLDVLHLPFQKPNDFTNMKQLSQSAIHYILAGCWLNSQTIHPNNNDKTKVS